MGQAPAVESSRPTQSGWYTAAAIFWFEVLGLMGLASIAFVPVVLWVNGSSPSGPWSEGGPAQFALLLAVVGAVSVATWVVGARHARARASVFLTVGLLGLVGIAAAATSGAASLLLVTLWLGWPSVMLIVVWGPFLRSS